MAEKEKKKKKKESVNVNLPKAKASLKRQKEMKQMKGNYDDAWKAAGVIVTILIIGFIFLGGISQKSAWEWFKNFGENVGNWFASWFEGGDVVTNEDGIYWDPNGGSSNQNSDSSDGSESNEEQVTPEENNNSGGETNGETSDGNNGANDINSE